MWEDPTKKVLTISLARSQLTIAACLLICVYERQYLQTVPGTGGKHPLSSRLPTEGSRQCGTETRDFSCSNHCQAVRGANFMPVYFGMLCSITIKNGYVPYTSAWEFYHPGLCMQQPKGRRLSQLGWSWGREAELILQEAVDSRTRRSRK